MMTNEQKNLVQEAVSSVLLSTPPNEIHDFVRDSYIALQEERSGQLVAA